MSKRELAARVLGLPFPSRLRQNRGALRILAYHRIVARPWDDFPFDEDLISAAPQAFHAQMSWVKRHFEVVSFRDLQQCEVEGRAWPRRALIVTFDDGYRDNFCAAFPILRELNLPATIFLSTGHIGESKLFWWDAIAWCFKAATRDCVSFPEIGEKIPLQSKAQKRAAMGAVLGWAKNAPEAARRDFIANLPSQLDVEMPQNLAAKMHLSWDEVREMARNGIEFGSHTVTHPILRRVDAAQLRREVRDSKIRIETEIGAPVLAFAYPAGTRARRDEAARAMVEECGYRYAVAYDEGVEARPDRFQMPRLHVDRDQSLALFRANLRFPSFMLRP